MGLFDLFSKYEEPAVAKEDIQKTDFSNFKEVTDFLYEKSGITDLESRRIAVTNMHSYAQKQEAFTTKEVLSRLKSDDSFYQEIINIATVNETFFMREMRELVWLVQYIQDENTRLNILSIPSSSGEEIYSILIMLSECGFDISKITITGYDINSRAVSLAQEGVYSEHSLHKIEKSIRDKYFTKRDNSYQISSKFREKVNFKQKNIFELQGLSNQYDVIISRNMFIYFDDKNRSLALDIIVNLLKKNGIYIKGHADNIQAHPNLENIRYGVYKTLS